MAIDIPTIVLAVSFLQLLCGAALLYAFFAYRDAPAAAWWGVSHMVLAAGVLISMLGASTGADWITASAFVFFLSCAAMQWHGTRLLTGASGNLPLLVAGPVLIAAVNLLPVGEALPIVRGISAAVLNVSYFTASFLLLMRPRGERLRAYVPLAILFVANIIAMVLAPFGGLGGTEAGLPPLLSLPGLLHMEAQLFVLGTTIFVIAALRERKELTERKASSIDTLTGLANRRGFFESGEALIAKCTAEAKPVGVIAIDLDHFKGINDSFGHAAGDAVLRLFAQVARRSLKANDLVGRIGGEEFAALLYGSDAEATFAVAERIRKAFQAEAEFVDGTPVKATLCAGVAGADAAVSLDSLLKDADIALYRAKQNGRNRVEGLQAPMPAPGRIARVA